MSEMKIYTPGRNSIIKFHQSNLWNSKACRMQYSSPTDYPFILHM